MVIFFFFFYPFTNHYRGLHEDAGTFARRRYIGRKYKKIFDELQLFHYLHFGKISYRKRIVYSLCCSDFSHSDSCEKLFVIFLQIQNDEIQLDKLIEMANNNDISLDEKKLSECIDEGEFSNKWKFFLCVEENSYFPIIVTMECFEREINKIFLIIRKKSKRISCSKIILWEIWSNSFNYQK